MNRLCIVGRAWEREKREKQISLSLWSLILLSVSLIARSTHSERSVWCACACALFWSHYSVRMPFLKFFSAWRVIVFNPQGKKKRNAFNSTEDEPGKILKKRWEERDGDKQQSAKTASCLLPSLWPNFFETQLTNTFVKGHMIDGTR